MTPHDLELKDQITIMRKLENAEEYLRTSSNIKGFQSANKDVQDYIFLATIYIVDIKDCLKRYFGRKNEQDSGYSS